MPVSDLDVRNNLAQTPELVMPPVLGAQLAQLVEQWTENPRVRGSNPRLGTISNFPTNCHQSLCESLCGL